MAVKFFRLLGDGAAIGRVGELDQLVGRFVRSTFGFRMLLAEHLPVGPPLSTMRFFSRIVASSTATAS